MAEPLALGLRALDGLLTAGRGQRIGLFAGAGVGKSTLLGQVARGARADLSVICLVGERGREVREFVEEALGPEGLARSVVVVATSDAPALVRLRAAHVATAIAEWFAEQGADVLFLLDSVTRFARAQREVGLAAGEPPARQGYPASVFQALPRLLERTGNRARGAITAIYTVLVAGGDLDEPIADEVRGILDGHVVLDRRLAERGHFPAIDVLASVSRVMPRGRPRRTAPPRRGCARCWPPWSGAASWCSWAPTRPGSDPETDRALARATGAGGLPAPGAARPSRSRPRWPGSRSWPLRLAAPAAARPAPPGGGGGDRRAGRGAGALAGRRGGGGRAPRRAAERARALGARPAAGRDEAQVGRAPAARGGDACRPARVPPRSAEAEAVEARRAACATPPRAGGGGAARGGVAAGAGGEAARRAEAALDDRPWPAAGARSALLDQRERDPPLLALDGELRGL